MITVSQWSIREYSPLPIGEKTAYKRNMEGGNAAREAALQLHPHCRKNGGRSKESGGTARYSHSVCKGLNHHLNAGEVRYDQ